jgi:hypothetical protein
MTRPIPPPEALSLRWATILLTAMIAALLTGALTFAQTTSWPTALLAAMGAGGAAVPAAHLILAHR